MKVLDVGLAKVAQASACDSGDPESSPTLTLAGTQAAMIMGTAAYMAPEQARAVTRWIAAPKSGRLAQCG